MKDVLKKSLSLLMTVSVLGACSGGNGNTPVDDGEDKIKIGFVTDVGGINDRSFNQTSYAGVKKFADEYKLVEGEDVKYLQSDKETDYIPNLTTFAEEGVDLILAAGFLFADAIAETAANYPDQNILIIDVDWLDTSLKNVQQAVFNEHEGSYLVGVAAGLMAKNAGKDTVGYITGQDSVTMQKFEAGYQAGVWSVYPECKILYDNANDFTSQETGKTLAAKQYNQGAYVIFHAAGGTGMGVISETADRRDAGEDVWVIGVDSDQYEYGKYGDEGKSAVLTSMLKRVDTASYNAAKAVADGTFTGGVVRYSLADGGVGIPEENPNLSESILTEIDKAYEAIANGDIKVPDKPQTSADNPLVIGH